MSTRIKLRTDSKDKIKLAPGSVAGESVLTVELTNYRVRAWNDGAISPNNGWVNVTVAGDSTGFPINTTPSNNVINTDINRVKITGSTRELEIMQRLIFLKDDVKTLRGGKGTYSFEIKQINRDLTNQASTWNISLESTPGAHDRIIELTAADFDRELTANDVLSIDDTIYYDNSDSVGNEKPGILVNRKDNEFKTLIDFETFLNDVINIKYFRNNAVSANFTNGADFTLVDTNAEITKLADYKYDYFSTGVKDTNNMKHTIYDSIYREPVDSFIYYLESMEKWHSYGFVNKLEVAIVLNNGFTIAADGAQLTIKLRHYKGFPVINPGQTATAGATKTDVIKVTNAKYDKLKIESFRHTNWFGGTHDVDFSNEVAADGCRGFQPGDLTTIGAIPIYNGHGENMSNDVWSGVTDKKITKIAIDIWNADNLEEAIDLAFFGVTHNQVVNKNDDRYKNKTSSSYLLKFNEVAGKSELEMLEIYYEAIKHKSCGARGGLVLTDWSTSNYYSAQAAINTDTDSTGVAANNSPEKQIVNDVDNAYKEIKIFLGIYKDADTAIVETDKNAWERAKENLEEWVDTSLNENKAKIRDHWKVLIGNKITTLEGKINGTLTNFVDDDKIDKAKKNKSQTAQNLLEKSKKQITQTQLTKLLELITWIEKGDVAIDATNYDENALLKLRDIKISTKTDEKAVWDKVVKDFREKDVDNENWVEKVLKKLEKILTSTRNDAKGVIDKIGINDPYNSSGINDLTSVIKINEIKDLFKFCYDAYQLQKREIDDKTLNTLKEKKISNTNVWIAVNNHKKSDKDEVKNEGYAAGVMKYLRAFIEKDLKEHNEILIITDEKELEKIIEAKSTNLEGNTKEEFDKIKTPMYKGRLKLKDTIIDEEKELKELLGLTPDQYEDTRDDLNAIEERIIKLRSYESAPETDKKGRARKKSGGDTIKDALALFIAKMENKKNAVKTLVEEHERKKKTFSSPERSFWEKPLRVFTILGGIVAILTVIVYFLKRNASEEENN